MSLRRLYLVAMGVACLSFGAGTDLVAAEDASLPSQDRELEERERALQQKLKGVLDELEDVKERRRATGQQASTAGPVAEPTVEVPPGGVPEIALRDIRIMSQRVEARPTGVTQSSTDRSEHESQPTRHLRESLESIPGIVTRQEHGGREANLSIRGSGNKTGCCVRNVKVYEDGFSVTQPDGLTRSEMHDPWFLQSIEVRRGPSSSLYDNYALGGMVHMKTRRGRDIDGVETFLSVG